jgi:uncharacterized RDD family membrane protein YckC
VDEIPGRPAADGEDRSVLGLDNVPVELPVAGVGNRALAAFIDHFVLAVLMIAMFLAFAVVMAATESGGGWFIAVWLLLLFVLNWGYFAVSEIVTQGRTVGKKAVGLRVVTEHGGSPSAVSLVVRNLLRLVDNLVGIVLIAVDPMARRLGDRLAGTLVVHERRAGSELVLGRVPQGWGAREVALVEAFLDRRETLEPSVAHRIARRIVLWVERDDPGFLAPGEREPDPVITVWREFGAERL